MLRWGGYPPKDLEFGQMTTNEIRGFVSQLPSEQLQVLQVVVEKYGKGQDFAGAWIRAACVERAVLFHPSVLARFAAAGLLETLDSSRRGHRRYYRLKHLDEARAPLRLN